MVYKSINVFLSAKTKNVAQKLTQATRKDEMTHMHSQNIEKPQTEHLFVIIKELN